MKVLRLVRRHIGRKADFSRVRIAPSVIPVMGSLMPRFMDLDVGQHVAALVDYGVSFFVVRSEMIQSFPLGVSRFKGSTYVVWTHCGVAKCDFKGWQGLNLLRFFEVRHPFTESFGNDECDSVI